MAEWLSFAGAACIIASTIPQAVQLARTRNPDAITWGLAALTSLGAALLMLRAYEVGDWGFVLVNGWATAFWGMVVAMKVWKLRRDRASGRAPVPRPGAPVAPRVRR